MTVIDRPTAELWLSRWDAQQERYIADREERFTVIADVVREVAGDTPAVVDLGCGPGSLAARLAEVIPGARITGVDADPLLLALAQARYPHLRFSDADLTDPEWPRTAGLPETLDAAVSTTALHWLPREATAALYRRLAELIAPGGVFVNGDNLPVGAPALAPLAKRVRELRAQRAGVGENEDWQEWWAAVQDEPLLGELVDERSRRAIEHGGDNGLSLPDHVDLLRDAGFREAGPVWQSGDDTVLVALR